MQCLWLVLYASNPDGLTYAMWGLCSRSYKQLLINSFLKKLTSWQWARVHKTHPHVSACSLGLPFTSEICSCLHMTECIKLEMQWMYFSQHFTHNVVFPEEIFFIARKSVLHWALVSSIPVSYTTHLSREIHHLQLLWENERTWDYSDNYREKCTIPWWTTMF